MERTGELRTHHVGGDELTHAVYGLILMVAGLVEFWLHETDAGDAALGLLGAAAVLLVAHVYSSILGQLATDESMGPSTVAAIAGHQLPVAAAVVPAAVVFGLAAAGAYGADAAYRVNAAGSFVALYVIGTAVGRRHGRRWPAALSIGAVTAAVGGAIALLELVAD